ncbi:halocyanin domain-containing protein [Halobacterium litoreum]|uniref:Halocyanin domain-containing protein n=1 Tax=Halobacterium litoreum TaxID=2039234 RepID=A0ABD5NAY1_9EURY|nr:halocyanin domain-containing protein [Halobacterium litoreum]UHH14636.1 halocyanin domain-containing protein [Halobacterium litoreum]
MPDSRSGPRAASGRGVARRRVLRGTAVGAVVALAGCAGGGGGGDTLPGSDYPAVDEWLTETAVGDSDDTYGGRVVDSRGQDAIDVDVGSEGNGGFYAFGPSAVAVSPGTTVTWRWTGEGGAHNVEAEADEQIGESDFEFSSGEAVDSDEETFEQTLDRAGVALYHCEPHLSVGMKGAVVVAEE